MIMMLVLIYIGGWRDWNIYFRMQQQIKVDENSVFEMIYSLIWRRDQYIKLESSFQFKVPNTILFINRTPSVWYFSGKDNKVLKKQNVDI